MLENDFFINKNNKLQTEMGFTLPVDKYGNRLSRSFAQFLTT